MKALETFINASINYVPKAKLEGHGETRRYDVTDVVIDVSFYQTFPHRILFPWGMRNKMIKKPIFASNSYVLELNQKA